MTLDDRCILAAKQEGVPLKTSMTNLLFNMTPLYSHSRLESVLQESDASMENFGYGDN